MVQGDQRKTLGNLVCKTAMSYLFLFIYLVTSDASSGTLQVL